MKVIENKKILEEVKENDEIQVEAKIYYRNKKQEKSYLLTYYMEAKDYKKEEIIKRMKTLVFFKGSIEEQKLSLKLKKEL